MKLQQIKNGLDFFQCPLTLSLNHDLVRIVNHPITQQQYQLYSLAKVIELKKRKGLCPMTRSELPDVKYRHVKIELLVFIINARKICQRIVSERQPEHAAYSIVLSTLNEHFRKLTFNSNPGNAALITSAEKILADLENQQFVDLDPIWLEYLQSFGVDCDLKIQRTLYDEHMQNKLLSMPERLSVNERCHLAHHFEDFLENYGLSNDMNKRRTFDKLAADIIPLTGNLLSRRLSTKNMFLIDALYLRQATSNPAQRDVLAFCIELLRKHGRKFSSQILKENPDITLIDSLAIKLLQGAAGELHAIHIELFKSALENGQRLSENANKRMLNHLANQRTTILGYWGLDYKHLALMQLASTEFDPEKIDHLLSCMNSRDRDFIIDSASSAQREVCVNYLDRQPYHRIDFDCSLRSGSLNYQYLGDFFIPNLSMKNCYTDAPSDHRKFLWNKLLRMAQDKAEICIDNLLLNYWNEPACVGLSYGDRYQKCAGKYLGLDLSQSASLSNDTYTELLIPLMSRKLARLRNLPTLLMIFFTNEDFVEMDTDEACNVLANIMIQQLMPNHTKPYTTSHLADFLKLRPLVDEIKQLLPNHSATSADKHSIYYRIKVAIQRFLDKWFGLDTSGLKARYRTQLIPSFQNYLSRSGLHIAPLVVNNNSQTRLELRALCHALDKNIDTFARANKKFQAQAV